MYYIYRYTSEKTSQRSKICIVDTRKKVKLEKLLEDWRVKDFSDARGQLFNYMPRKNKIKL